MDSSVGTKVGSLESLFRLGVIGNLTDGQLLEKFLTAEQETAQAVFTALVERHAPMVFAVSRTVLNNTHDAQDASQATFLVLASKANSVRNAGSLASWLHGVAYRIALSVKSAEARRRTIERELVARSAVMEPFNGVDRPESWPELHEEISRLPQRFREPIVLCYLEGLTTEAAAYRIGCPRGTILSRLSRAKERLRVRLTRRGLGPLLELLPMSFHSEAATATIPRALIGITAKTSLQFSHQPSFSTNMASTTAVALAKGFLHMKAYSRLAVIATALTSVVTLGGLGAIAQPYIGQSVTEKQNSAHGNAENTESQNTHDPVPTEATPEKPEDTNDQRVGQHSTEAVMQVKLDEANGEIARLKRKLHVISGELHSISFGTQSHINPSQVLLRTDAGQPSVHFGRLIVAASPTGNNVTAYDPVTHKNVSVSLHATKDNPIRVTPVAFGNLVSLGLEGRKITRIAVYSSTTHTWHPLNLSESFKGKVIPKMVSNDEVYYDLGRHIFTFTNKTGKWDHLDLATIDDDSEEDAKDNPKLNK